MPSQLPKKSVVHAPEHRAFLSAAAAWSRSRNERDAARMLRSPYSRVPHEIGAAYTALALREGGLLDLIARERLAVSGGDRDALIAFMSALRSGENLEAWAGEPPAPAQDDAGASVFALCEPVEPQGASGVRPANPRFSASQLNAYGECARKWYYRYVCAAVEDKGSSASYYGTAFHSALESFHHDYPHPGDVDPEELNRKLQGYVNAAFDHFRNTFDTPVEHELQVRRARRTAKKYVSWLVAESKRAPFTIAGCEVPVDLQIEGFNFVGYIDRIDSDDATGALSVVDYKTGTIATSAAEYREKVRQFLDFQLPFYYWARTDAGDRVWKLALVPLKDALLDVRPIVLEVVPLSADISRSNGPVGVIPVAELERARTRMVEICRELTSGSISAFAVANDPSACKYCAYRIACANHPYPEEERFGR